MSWTWLGMVTFNKGFSSMALQMAFFAWMFPDQQRRATLNTAKQLRLEKSTATNWSVAHLLKISITNNLIDRRLIPTAKQSKKRKTNLPIIRSNFLVTIKFQGSCGCIVLICFSPSQPPIKVCLKPNCQWKREITWPNPIVPVRKMPLQV